MYSAKHVVLTNISEVFAFKTKTQYVCHAFILKEQRLFRQATPRSVHVFSTIAMLGIGGRSTRIVSLVLLVFTILVN